MGRSWITAGAAFAVLAATGIAVAAGATRGADRAFTVWLQSFASPALDRLADLNTIVGQSTVDAALALLLAAYLFRRGPRWAWLAPLFIGAVVGLELVGKFLLSHPGPPPEFIRTTFDPLGIKVATPSSFPSGHVSRTTFLAICIGGAWPSRAVGAILAAIAAATPLARVYLGDHWLSDTIGGLALGALGGVLALRWLAFTARASR